MKKPYMALRQEMLIQDKNQQYLAKLIKKSDRYVNDRINNKYPWTVEDAWLILKDFGKEEKDFPIYFPRDPMKFVRV